MIQVDCIVRGGCIITMNRSGQIIRNGALALREGILIAVDTAETIAQQYTAPCVVDCGTDCIVPGFINAHSHAPMVLLRGYADDLPLEPWLSQRIFPLEKKLLSEDFTYYGTLLALIEMVQGGTTTMVDMYWYVNGSARACRDVGMRAILGSAILHHNHELDETEKFIEAWQHHDLITCAVAPHSVSNVPGDILRKAYALACDYNLLFLLHVNETLADGAVIREKYHRNAIAFLEDEQMLSRRCVLAHMVHSLPDDLERVAQAGAGIVHCPTSNMKLASGIAPVVSMLKCGCNVGLGTDGAASNNSLDMLAEMKIMTLLQRVHTLQADCITAYDALEAATIGGARAIHKDHEIGSLEVGKKADLVSISSHELHQLPNYDPVSTLVYATNRCDVRTVMINGVLKVRDGAVQLPAELVQEVRSYAERLKALVK